MQSQPAPTPPRLPRLPARRACLAQHLPPSLPRFLPACSLRSVYRREFITDFARVEGIPVRPPGRAGRQGGRCAGLPCALAPCALRRCAAAGGRLLVCLEVDVAAPPHMLFGCLPTKCNWSFDGYSCIEIALLQGMFIANQVDEAAMGAATSYTDFLQASGHACRRCCRASLFVHVCALRCCPVAALPCVKHCLKSQCITQF